jgi:3-oxoadipate enol-lactonase
MEADVNGIQMFYQDQGEGYPLVLIHGFPLDHTIWAPLFPLLIPEARIITPDLRGFGRSSVPEETYNMDQLADDIAGLLDHLQIERAVVVGHSMGGYVSLAVAQKYPSRLSGLGLLSSQAFADTPERREGRYATARKVEENGVEAVAGDLASKLTPIPLLQDRVKSIILNTKPAGIIGALKGMAERPDAVPYLEEIEVPTIVIAGTKDELIPVGNSKPMMDHFSNARWLEIEQASHMAMMETPVIVADALKQLIKDVRERPTS